MQCCWVNNSCSHPFLKIMGAPLIEWYQMVYQWKCPKKVFFPGVLLSTMKLIFIGQCCLNIIQCCMIDSKKIDGHSHFGPEKGEYSHITITCTPINAIGDINKKYNQSTHNKVSVKLCGKKSCLLDGQEKKSCLLSSWKKNPVSRKVGKKILSSEQFEKKILSPEKLGKKILSSGEKP